MGIDDGLVAAHDMAMPTLSEMLKVQNNDMLTPAQQKQMYDATGATMSGAPRQTLEPIAPVQTNPNVGFSRAQQTLAQQEQLIQLIMKSRQVNRQTAIQMIQQR